MATTRDFGGSTDERAREWGLLLSACRKDRAGLEERLEERSSAAANAADWEGLLRLMDAQGVGPLCADALRSVDAPWIPEEVRAALTERVRMGELRAGIQVPELLEIVETLEARGIDTIAHKGPALSVLAYGRAGIRDSVDLDLIVRESDVTAAEQALRQRGYHRNNPGDLRPRVDAAWRRVGNEIEFASEERWVFVDLHWRLFPTWFPFQVQPRRLWSGLARATVGERQLQVLSAETQLVVHCLHGAKDRWRKVLWLCDLDRLIRASPALDWDAILDLAEASRGQRAVGLGLRLAHRLLGTPVPASVHARLADDRGLARLLDKVERDLSRGGLERPWWMVAVDVWPFHFEVFDTRRDGLAYLARAVVTPVPWGWELVNVRLPDVLYPLYYLLRPLRLLAGLARKLVLRTLRRPVR